MNSGKHAKTFYVDTYIYVSNVVGNHVLERTGPQQAHVFLPSEQLKRT